MTMMKTKPNIKPSVFIGSSVEDLDAARMVGQLLEYDADARPWDQGDLFQLTGNTLDDLIKSLDKFDFGIFILTPRDVVKIRKQKFLTARDNVVFELGLFMGRLGKERSFLIVPRNQRDFHLPTDLLAVNPATFDPDKTDWSTRLGTCCNQIRGVIRRLHIRPRESAKFSGDWRNSNKKVFDQITKATHSRAAEPHKQMARLLLSREKDGLEKALQMLDDPQFQKPAYHLNLAYGFWSIGELRQAIHVAEKGLRLAEKVDRSLVSRFRNSLAYYYADTGKRQFEKQARKYAVEALKARPGEPACLDTLGYVKITYGRTKREVSEGVDLCDQARRKGVPFSGYVKHVTRANQRIQTMLK